MVVVAAAGAAAAAAMAAAVVVVVEIEIEVGVEVEVAVGTAPPLRPLILTKVHVYLVGVMKTFDLTVGEEVGEEVVEVAAAVAAEAAAEAAPLYGEPLQKVAGVVVREIPNQVVVHAAVRRMASPRMVDTKTAKMSLKTLQVLQRKAFEKAQVE